jgi:hypothetical protein
MASIQSDLGLAEKLKGQLREFATSGAARDEYKRYYALFFDLSDQADENLTEIALDWFIYDWFDENGEGVIERFLASSRNLSDRERQILVDWEDSINSVFEICWLGKGSMRLKDIASGDIFSVVTSESISAARARRGQFIAARLLPLGDRFIFAGKQFIMPNREAAQEVLDILQSLDAIDSPEAIEKAQQEQCCAFREYFGQAELTVPLGELKQTLERFQHYLFFERRNPETNATMAETFRSEFGRELKLPEMPVPPVDLSAVSEVTILCDEFDGLLLLPDYNRFKRVFEADDPDREIPGWRELVWDYIKNPDIPIVAFERVAEEHAMRLESILRELFGNKDFSIEHLYAALLHYREPVEGFEDLEDDQWLWDLFNGKAGRRRKAKKPQASSAKMALRAKSKPAARLQKVSTAKKR